jgi:hemolysin D
VKIDSFPFTRYGTIRGRVLTLSDDAVNIEKDGLVYSAIVEIAKTALSVDGKLVNLSPGMAVTVEVKTGKRRLIEFLMSPLMKYQAESARER